MSLRSPILNSFSGTWCCILYSDKPHPISLADVKLASKIAIYTRQNADLGNEWTLGFRFQSLTGLNFNDFYNGAVGKNAHWSTDYRHPRFEALMAESTYNLLLIRNQTGHPVGFITFDNSNHLNNKFTWMNKGKGVEKEMFFLFKRNFH